MTLTTHHDLTGYEAAHHGAAVYRVPEGGALRIAGADQRDFIQRQTTNDIRPLSPERSVQTVLTSPTARILDVWRLVLAGDAITAITLPGRGPATLGYLQKRIFFKDQVTVADASAEIVQFELFGPAAADALVHMGLEAAPAPEAVVTLPIEDGIAHVIGAPEVFGGYLLVVPAERVGDMAKRLAAAGAEPITPAAYDVLRVELGRPGPAHELTDEHTPLEANLDAAISDSKGCYTGQEIIARQITYDKVTKRLVGIRLAGPCAPGDAVQVDGRSAGAITSVADSPQHGLLALAVIKRPHFEPGTEVTILGGEDGAETSTGTVAALPFRAG